MNCSEFCLGTEKMQVQGAAGGPLAFSSDDYGTIQLFSDMMSAGWQVPGWLENEEWDCLQLTGLTIAGLEKLPAYSPEMPITITHRPAPVRHILEKAVTLQVGKRRSFSFTDNHGDEVWCHINNVTLIDVWKSTEEQLNDSKLAENFSPEQLAQAREHRYKALEQNCPEGMCYAGIEYECSKDLCLTFYTREYLKSCPTTHHGSSYFLLMRLKPDKETGIHGLPSKAVSCRRLSYRKPLKFLRSYFFIMKRWMPGRKQFCNFCDIPDARACCSPKGCLQILPYKIRPLERLLFGNAILFPAKGDAFHKKRHISRQRPHSLQSFHILLCFACRPPVDTVPILA